MILALGEMLMLVRCCCGVLLLCGLGLFATLSLVILPADGAPAPKNKSKSITNSLGMKFVLIPAGKFTMGSPGTEMDRKDHEGPQHEVEITKPFYLGIHEVTLGQFKEFVKDSKYVTDAEKTNAGGDWKKFGLTQNDKHPVVWMSWNDATKFCEWLSKVPKEKNAGRSYRLAYEAEWEYACRAGAKKYQVFHYGDSLSSTDANFDGSAPYGNGAKGPNLNKTAPVGSYRSNAWGLYDMHGNANEWCHDWYGEDYYKNSPKTDPKGPEKGTDRVARGFGWINPAHYLRSASRSHVPPTSAGPNLGFRVVLVK